MYWDEVRRSLLSDRRPIIYLPDLSNGPPHHTLSLSSFSFFLCGRQPAPCWRKCDAEIIYSINLKLQNCAKNVLLLWKYVLEAYTTLKVNFLHQINASQRKIEYPERFFSEAALK